MSLNGTQGPHDGWLVGGPRGPGAPLGPLAWRAGRGSAWWAFSARPLVIGWAVLTSWRDSREVLEASVGYGLLLVFAASLALAAAGLARGVELFVARR